MAALTVSNLRDSAAGTDVVWRRNIVIQAEPRANGTERYTVLRIKIYPSPGAVGSDSFTPAKTTIGPTTPVHDIADAGDRVAVRRIKTFPHPGATGTDSGETKGPGGWIYIQSDVANATDYNINIKINAGKLGLIRDNGYASDRLVIRYTGSNLLQGLTVWSGSVELPVVTLSVWNGSVEVPVTGFSVT